MDRGNQLKSDCLRLASLMGLCLALGVYLILTATLISKDGVFYIEQARRIAVDPVAVCRRYPPGYPFLVWIGHGVASMLAEGDSPLLWAYSAQAVTLLCRVLALAPLYLLGRLLVGATNSFWALFVLIILPYPAFYGSDALREWPHLLFLSTGLLLLYTSLMTRRWWLLALVGLDAGLGYLIRPECAQLILYTGLGLLVVRESSRVPVPSLDLTRRLGAGLLLIAGFVVPVIPYVRASGSIVPHQLRPSLSNAPPTISAVGPKAATGTPLEFEVRAGELLELPVQAADPDRDALTFSLVGVPMGARPAHLFRTTAAGAEFWTVSEEEKDRLAAYGERWDYEAVPWYAYAASDVRPGLRPVYRFWSAAQERHFFTMNESEKDTILAQSAAEPWTFEGAVFYAFPEANHPADAAAVYRCWAEEQGYSWQMNPAAASTAQKDAVAWYAHPAGEPPAGARIEEGTFRWRPDPGQQGEHQMNIVVTDGRLSCCQLLLIHVVGAGPTGHERLWDRRPSDYPREGQGARNEAGLSSTSGRALASVWRHADLRRSFKAVSNIVGGISENLMVIPVLPWVLGLFCHLKYSAKRPERVLVPAFLIVTTGLMFGRYVWLAPDWDRRYALATVALTIFYLPVGLDVIARRLNRLYTFKGKLAAFGAERRPPWFYILLVGGVVLCTPKLIFKPLRAEKAGYRVVSEWLARNAPAEAVVAVPDPRIAFYADRQGLFYRQYPNARKADYIVKIADGDSGQTPEGWTREHSTAVGADTDKTLVIYRTSPAKP